MISIETMSGRIYSPVDCLNCMLIELQRAVLAIG